MDTREMCKNLKKSISEVFESMFFIFPEKVGEGETGPPVPENHFCARVSIKGSGTAFMLCSSKPLVESMAKNLLGEEKSMDEESLMDVFKEAVNVIAGNLLTAGDVEGDISLGVPRGERIQGKTGDIAVQSVCEAVFSVENEWLKGAIIKD